MGKIVSVPFRDDLILATEEDGEVFVAVKPISDRLGLKWNAQFERLQRDPILSKGIRIIRMPSWGGGAQDTLCLRMNLLNGWLFGIDTGRIKDPVVRETVLVYQAECYEALFRHFYAKAAQKTEALPVPADKAPFPEWPMEELRTKRGVADMYRLVYGVAAAQWILPQLGFPLPPKEMIEHGRQFDMFRPDFTEVDAA